MTQYSIEARVRKYVKGYGFLSFIRNFSNGYRKQLLDAGLDALKNASKKEVHKADEFIENKIAGKIVKSVEELTIPPEKREHILYQLRQALKLVTKKWIEVRFIK